MSGNVESIFENIPAGEEAHYADEILRRTYRKSLLATAKSLMGYKDVNKRTHGEIIKCLEGPSKRKLICVPRGCLKSSIACVAFPIWLLINNPNLRIMIDSELYTNSSTFVREIKAHLLSKNMSDLFGDFKGTLWNEGEFIIKQRTKKLKEASVTAAGIGTTKVGQHFDVIIHDDMNSPMNSNTPENAAKVIDHFRYNISILEPDGLIVVIGTRYAENDIIGWILENQETNYGEKKAC